ncbi:hypothetical protein K435DRAFT_965568 [Dendrothele bispora CBS 962.96]|uniref:DUF6534 domain-containing protein n=1 Tax=Dendrothele bispora (strain CBS 962.96) TaxID=1314807 RepID=A0A4V4HG30_DENBC|nr:hypothetical protein K435DRAFT_965568 [Dendrothele bispora CBS 962.96]
MAQSPLAPTFGIWLVSLFLATILYGIALLQTWLYFHWYSSDSWAVKSTVIFLLLLETLHICFFFAGTYHALIDHFGLFELLTEISWLDSAQLLLGYLSAFVVQVYFGYRIYLLDKKKIVITGFIMALALTQIAAGLTQTVKVVQLGDLKLLDTTKQITSVQSAASLFCDIVITATLYLTLRGKKGPVRATNNMLKTLMTNAINRGLVTAVAAGINLVLFLAIPGTFYFFLGLVPSSKLYMNSMLATLNTRRHVAKIQYDSENGWHSIPIGTLPSSAGASRNGALSAPSKSMDFDDESGGGNSRIKPAIVNIRSQG